MTDYEQLYNTYFNDVYLYILRLSGNEHIAEEMSYERPEGEIDLKDFLYTDIYEEGMVGRVAKCAEDTQNYYNEKNNEK